MLNLTNKTLIILVMLAMLMSLTACSDDDDPMTPNTQDLGTGVMLRVVHASPNAPAVDVYVRGIDNPVLSGLDYTETSAYLEVGPGDYIVDLRAAGADPMSPAVYSTGVLTLPDGATITAAAVGMLGSTDAADMFRVIPLVEDYADAGSGNAAVRIVHASADAPSVAIDVGNDGTPEISDFARFADTGAAGIPLPAGQNLDVGIWAGNPLNRVTAFQTPALPEADLLLIATGLLSADPSDDMGFGLLAVGPEGTVGLIRQNPVVFVMHASPDAPAVDVFVGGTNTELVDNLSFGNLSSAVQVPPASYDLDVKVAADGGLAATVQTPELVPGMRYLAVASGFVGGDSPAFTLLAYADEFGDGMSSNVRVIHASPGAPSVDVGILSAGTSFAPIAEFTNLGFGDASSGSGLAIDQAALTLGVSEHMENDPVATFDLQLGGIDKAFAVAAGSLTGTGEAFRLVVVDASTFPWQAAAVMPNP